ncbi:MAG TPA: hypothetical protein VH253_03495 [Phycisphaerae bacterium]|nr:hypothetical protein [Phycisphaerae bacterium]
MTTTRSTNPGPAASSLRKRIRETLAAYKTIQAVDKQWSAAVRDGTMSYSKSVAKNFQSQYQRWLLHADHLLTEVKQAQRQGNTIPGFAELRDAIGFCPAPLDIDAIAESFRRLDRGEGIPLAEAVNGKILHRRAS